MKTFFGFVLSVIRLFILVKVTYLLYKTSVDEVNYPLDKLTWWIYYLVFDIWMTSHMTFAKQVQDED